VFLSPETRHLRAIADQTGLPYSVVQREVDRLEEGRLVYSQRFGASRVVRPNVDHPLHSELRALLMKAYGPQMVISELLSNEPGVEAAYLFGSWADRYHGNWGAEWGDVDVAIVGRVPPVRAEELEAAADDALAWPTQIVVITPDAWSAGSESFVRTVKSRPLVPIDLPERST
jgi:predicted nucleotidyltransferase